MVGEGGGGGTRSHYFLHARLVFGDLGSEVR